jgi:DNA-binding NarL/FixJ family response regulator
MRIAPDDVSKVRLFFFARNDFMIDGMMGILSRHDDNHVVACVEPGDGCVAKFEAANPDILLLQNDAIDQPAAAFIGNVRQRFPNVRIILFGIGLSDDQLYDAVRAGVRGYINEHMSGEHILQAVRAVVDGQMWFERRIMERFVTEGINIDNYVKVRFLDNVREIAERLTRREKDVLRQVMRGLSIREIAEEVHLSSQGVKSHLANLFKKFDVTNRSQLILRIFEQATPVADASELLCSNLTCQQAS